MLYNFNWSDLESIFRSKLVIAISQLFCKKVFKNVFPDTPKNAFYELK